MENGSVVPDYRAVVIGDLVLYSCPWCGCIIDDTEVHTRYHRGAGRTIHLRIPMQ